MESTEWYPQKGDIVCLKQGFDRSFESLAARRAGLPLRESAMYEVAGIEHRTPNVVLVLREVRVFHVAGVRHVIGLGTELFPYAADRFQAVFTSEPDRSSEQSQGSASRSLLRDFQSIKWRTSMPHVIVKLWPGKSEQQKKNLAAEITKAVMTTLHYGDESVSVAMEEVKAADWTEKVYRPDILGRRDKLYKEPGYKP